MADESPEKRLVGRWFLVTVILYLFAMGVLTAPFLYAAFNPSELFSARKITFLETLEIYESFQYWIFFGALTLLCSASLLVPMKIARRKNVTRRSWRGLAVLAGLLMGLLMGALLFAVFEVIMRKEFLGNPIANIGSLGIAIGGWIFWSIVFFRYWRDPLDQSIVSRVMNKVLAGSITELLVAVPSHIYVREQTYCCASAGTFTGMAFGFSVMLLGFGPGVFFLFMRRVDKLRGAETGEAQQLGQHSRDAMMWAGIATTWLLLAIASRAFSEQKVIEPGAVAMLHELLRLSFFVTGCCALYHGVKAALARENRWRWVVGGLVLAGEVLALVYGLA